MLDLETMGDSADAAIISMGAVKFSRSGVSSRFYTAVDLADSVAHGGVISPATVIWWLNQSLDARKAVASKDAVGIVGALDAFDNWLCESGPAQDVKLWGNGAAFDNVILANTYARLGRQTPWRFWNDRCYRTTKNLYPDIKLNRTGTHHNALDDAETQAQHLVQIVIAKNLTLA